MHVSYHKDGRVNHNADRPNKNHVPVRWDISGEMEPMIRDETPVKDIVGRQRVAGTGWATEDMEKAALPEFVPNPCDIVVDPTTLTVGFSGNIIGPGIPARSVGHLNQPILARYVRGTAPLIEVEIFDWMAPQAPAQRLMRTIRMTAPCNDGAWLLDDEERCNTREEAVTAVVEQHGVPDTHSARSDGGVKLYYHSPEDDHYQL
jgi:hypothetical protein